jgi:hypothetical protein
MMRCCFDKRVWIGLGVLAAGLLIVDPRVGWVALPVLAGLACPVSMLVMMRGMRPGIGSAGAAAPGGEHVAGIRDSACDRAVEIGRLRREIRQLQAHAGDVTLAAADPATGARGAAGRADPASRGASAAGG